MPRRSSRVAAHCLAADQLLEVVHARQVDAVVVAWGLHRLSDSVLAQLERARVPLLLLVPDPEASAGSSRQATLLPMEVEPAALREAVHAAARGERPLRQPDPRCARSSRRRGPSRPPDPNS